MAEAPITSARAAIYYFNTENTAWEQADGGLSDVFIYKNAENLSFRVVAMSQADKKVVINSSVFKELSYQKSSDTFHNWADSVHMYGLNFTSVEEATTFETTVKNAIVELEAAAPKPPPPKPAPPPVKDEGGSDEPPLPQEPPPEEGKPAPPKPAPPSGDRPKPAPPSGERAQPQPPSGKGPRPPQGKAPPERKKPTRPAHQKRGIHGAATGTRPTRGGRGGRRGRDEAPRSRGGSVAARFQKQMEETKQESKKKIVIPRGGSEESALKELQGELLKIFKEELEKAKEEILQAVREELEAKKDA